MQEFYGLIVGVALLVAGLAAKAYVKKRKQDAVNDKILANKGDKITYDHSTRETHIDVQNSTLEGVSLEGDATVDKSRKNTEKNDV